MLMYSTLAQLPTMATNMADLNHASGTINPADLNSHPVHPQTTLEPSPRGIKRSRSPDQYGDFLPGGGDEEGDDQHPRVRGRPFKTPRTSGDFAGATDSLPTPLSQTSPGTSQTPRLKSQGLPSQAATTPTKSSPPLKATPSKSNIKALPTVRDHTSDQLGPGGDEYIPRETDAAGEEKVDELGYPQGGREYKCRTFTVTGRGNKLFMLATECARVLTYRDSYLLFNKNRSLYKIIATQKEKEELINQEILPFSYRSRQIAIVTARSMFRQFGSRVIKDGRRVRDDYWEAKAVKQGFTELDPAGEKRPGASRAREAAAAESHRVGAIFAPQNDIVYSNGPGFGTLQPPALPLGIASTMAPLSMINALDPRYRDVARPRRDLPGPAYIDTMRPSNETDLMTQAAHSADYSKALGQQRSYRKNMLEDYWNKPHEPRVSTPQSQPAEPAVAPSDEYTSPRFSASDLSSTQPNPLLHPQSGQQSMNPPPYNPHQQNPMPSPLRNPSIQASMLRDASQYNPGAQQPPIHRSSSNLSVSHPQPPSNANPYNAYANASNQVAGQQMWGQPPPHPSQSPSLHRPQSQYSPHMHQGQIPQSPHHPSQSPHQPGMQQQQQQQQPPMMQPGAGMYGMHGMGGGFAGMGMGMQRGIYPSMTQPGAGAQYLPQSTQAGGPTQGWSGSASTWQGQQFQ